MRISGAEEFEKAPGMEARNLSNELRRYLFSSNVQEKDSLYPTGLLTILEPQAQEIREFRVVEERFSTGFEAEKL